MKKKQQGRIMRRNSLNTLLLLVTTVNAYGVVRLQQHYYEDDTEETTTSPPVKYDGDFAYVVSLQEWSKGDDHIINVARLCVGSAITHQWILTAGHCISKKLSHVEYGEDYNKNYSKIISKRLHPGYRFDYSFGGYYANLNNNIALIKVEDMILNKYARLSAREHSTVIGQVVKYAGFGGIKVNNGEVDRKKIFRADEDPNRTANDLRVVEGGIIKCEQERYIIIQPALCVAPKCGNRKHKTSQGDSGGPLTLDKRIIGVNSGNSPIMSDVFTPISPFFEWIGSTINKRSKSTSKYC